MSRHRLPTHLLARVAFGLFVVGLALLLAVSGCVAGSMCIRNTDCGAGSYCIKQQCVQRTVVEPDSGVADGSVAGAGSAGGAGAGDSGGASTSGSAGTSAGAETAGAAGA